MIEALDYPRALVIERLTATGCCGAEHFDPMRGRCHRCDLRQACHWLSRLDAAGDLAQRPGHVVRPFLVYGRTLVGLLTESLHHDGETCRCEPCAWRRLARELLRADARVEPPAEAGLHG